MKKLLRQLTIGPFEVIIARLNKRYQVRYKFNKKHLIADIILFLAVVLLIVFNFYIAFVFTKLVFSLNIKVSTEITENVRSGQEISYTVKYSNTDRKTDLSGVIVHIDLPEQFVLKNSSDPRFDVTTGKLPIGDLKARHEGYVILTGTTWGDVDSQQRVVSRLTYDCCVRDDLLNSLSWSDQVLAVEEYKIIGSVLTTSLTAPPVVVYNTPYDLALNISNNSDYDFSNLVISGLSGQDANLEKITAEQKPLHGQKTVEQIDQQQVDHMVTISGMVNGQRYVLDKLSAVSQVFYPHFNINVEPQVIAPSLGEEVSYVLTYRNDEDNNINNVSLSINFNNSGYAPEKLSSENKFTLTDGSVVWSLGELASGQEGDLSFSLPTNKQASVANLKFKPTVNYSLLYNDQKLDIAAALPDFEQNLSSTLGLESFARYFTVEGEQLGLGPLPPVIGIPTRYRVYLRLTNGLNAVDKTVVTATLPNNVSWQNKASVSFGPDLSYDATTRQVTWTVGRLEAYAGQNTAPIVASFEVEIIPTVAQRGSYAPLLVSPQINAVDQKTGRSLSSDGPSATTNLSGDTKAQAKGGKVSNF